MAFTVALNFTPFPGDLTQLALCHETIRFRTRQFGTTEREAEESDNNKVVGSTMDIGCSTVGARGPRSLLSYHDQPKVQAIAA